MSRQILILDDNGIIPSRHMPAAGSSRGIVCFTWDDGYPSWAALADKADTLGQRHTFAVTTNRIGTPEGVTAADVTDWHARGHEIASHSVTHASGTAEAVDAKVALEALVGAGNVTSYVYPYGNRSPDSDRSLYGNFTRVVDYQAAMPMAMSDRDGAFMLTRIRASASNMAPFIRLAAASPVVVVFAGHNPGGAGDVSTADTYAAMDLAASLGVQCSTLAEVFPGAGMLADPFFEQPGANAWSLFGGGMSIVTDTPASGLPGTRSLSIAISDTTGSAGQQIVNVEPGKSYTLSGRARLSAGTLTTGRIRARMVTPATYAGPNYVQASFNDAGTELVTTADVTTTTWTRFEVTGVAPADCRFIVVQLVVEGQAGITGRFDHIHFGPTHLGSFG